MDANNPHYEETKWSQKVYWKGGVACGRDDGPDRVELKASPSHYPTLDFAMPRQRYELEKVEALMRKAYERGLSEKMVEISNTLKAVIGL